MREYEAIADEFARLFPGWEIAWEEISRAARATGTDCATYPLITGIRYDVLQVLTTIGVASGDTTNSTAKIYQAFCATMDPDDHLSLADCIQLLSKWDRQPLALPVTVGVLGYYDRLTGNNLACGAAVAYAHLMIAISERSSESFAVATVKARYLELLRPYLAETFYQGSFNRSDLCEECRVSCELLGVSVEATREEVKTAFRDLAKIWHPDRFAEWDERIHRKAESQMQAINRAYAHLETHRTEGGTAAAKDFPQEEADQGDSIVELRNHERAEAQVNPAGEAKKSSAPVTLRRSPQFGRSQAINIAQSDRHTIAKWLFVFLSIFIGAFALWAMSHYRTAAGRPHASADTESTQDPGLDTSTPPQVPVSPDPARQTSHVTIQSTPRSNETVGTTTEQLPPNEVADVTSSPGVSKNTTPASQQDLGVRDYNQGRYNEALQHFMAAATAGNAEAERYLGYMYEFGRGVSENDAAAVEWFSKSVAAGDESAKVGLVGAQELMSGQQPQTTNSSVLQAAESGTTSMPANVQVTDDLTLSQANDGYDTYKNARFGHTIDFPKSFVQHKQPRGNGDGIVMTSPDGSALFIAIGGDNPGRTLREWYDASIKNVHGVLGDHRIGSTWFVISWTDRMNLEYLKMFVGLGSEKSFTFICPANRQTACGNIVARMEKSFVPGDVAEAR
ncbi:MAG: DnaJ domain-containing protein [Acidobacteriaceae bacterium]